MVVVLAALAAYGLLALICFFWADHAFMYSLDDPFIHLTLARNIQEGSYGINPGEWSSPSSSPLWPYLLALFPRVTMEYAPFALNAVFCAAQVWIFRELLRGPLLPARWQVAGAVLVGFGLNIFGIAMTGMEHSLQALLATFMAWRVVQRRFDVWLYAAMAVAPLVRYELAGLSFPLALYLWWDRRERLGPVLSVALAVAGLGAFSLYLRHLGLPMLPSSVLAKNAERSILVNVLLNPGFFFMLWWLWLSRGEERRAWWLLMALPLAGYMVLGRAGWLGRYEAYMASWLMVFCLAALQRLPLPAWQPKRWWHPHRPQRLFVGLCLCIPGLWVCTVVTPQACLNIQRQQALMAELSRQLAQPVAVNDLGLVGWRSGQYVVDLWGLGSPDVLALRLAKQKPPEVWMDEVTRSKNVHFAFVFQRWFPKVPPGWIKVGELRLNVQRVITPSDRVALFATMPEAVPALRAAMQRVAQDPIRRELVVQTP